MCKEHHDPHVEFFSSNSEVWKKRYGTLKSPSNEIGLKLKLKLKPKLSSPATQRIAKNPILHHFLIRKDHWIHLAKRARVLSPQIWASLEQSHPICTFLPSKAPWEPYGPLGDNLGVPTGFGLKALRLSSPICANINNLTKIYKYNQIHQLVLVDCSNPLTLVRMVFMTISTTPFVHLQVFYVLPRE
jgi:hypothetical protein